MKHILLTTIAAVVLVGCATTQSPEPSTAKAPDISIHDAVEEGNIEAVKQHLDARTDVNSKDEEFGMTPLHYGARGGHNEIVKLLIAAGTDVNATDDEWGMTPLHHAANSAQRANRNYYQIAELLITEGADVNAKNKYGRTPLFRAAYWGHKEIAEHLIVKGVDVNVKHKDGTPLDWANRYRKTKTADIIRKHGGKTGAELKAEGK